MILALFAFSAFVLSCEKDTEIKEPSASEQWTSHYTVDGYEGNFDKLMDNVILDYHTNNSIGKFIGMVPYGTAAENLAYLGADISLGGLPSSTYTGYDTNVDVLFIINLTDGDITSDANLNSRYEAGNLTYNKGTDNELDTKFMNCGNMYKYLASHFDGTDLGLLYQEKFIDWLKEVSETENVENLDVDTQGRVVEKQR